MSLVGQPVGTPYEILPEAVERISWLRRRLLSWFAQNGRSFPWREPGTTPYEVAVAEILLQRTTATGVARAYTGFVEANGGVLPRTRTELERLPGIGPYTASAVLAIVYGRAEPLLDVNMARLLGRFLGSSERIESNPRRTLHARALLLVHSKRSLEVNWAALISERWSAVQGARSARSVRCRPGARMPAAAPTYFQRRCSLRLTKRWWPMIMWSTNSISRMRPAATSCFVALISSGEG